VIAETIPAHPSASQSASVAHPGRASLEYQEWSMQVSPWKYPLHPCNLYYPTFTSNPPPNVRQQRGSQGRTSLYGILYILHSALWPASAWLRASAPGPLGQRSSVLDADSRPRPASIRRSLCSRSKVQRSPARANQPRPTMSAARTSSGELLLPWPQTPPRYSTTNRNGRSNRKLQPFSSPSSPKLRAPEP
jgi:hypothetical protein